MTRATASGPATRPSVSTIHGFPRVLRASARDGGYPLLTALVAEQEREPAHGDGSAAEAGAARLAARYRVSRSHVASLLADWRKRGWISQAGHGARIGIEPELRDEFDHWAAAIVVLYARCGREALAIDPAPGSRPDRTGPHASAMPPTRSG